ncbi:MAG: DNA primase, partial [Firmicutes bacterium]|nr:DNA primase [Bacillota bacterium]
MAAYYPDELIEEVRSRSDIVAVVGSRVKLTKRGANYWSCCPFHSEKTPSFSVSQNKQMYYCFGCGAGGNVVTFLMNYENWTFPEALEYLAERAGITLPKREMTGEEKARDSLRSRLLEINGEAAKFYYYQLRQSVGKPGMEYLTRRGLSAETLRRFGLGYAPDEGYYSKVLYRYLHEKGYGDEELKTSGLVRFKEGQGAYDFFRGKVIFPIMDKNSRVIAFGGRVLDGSKPKYINSQESALFDKKRTLYGLFAARSTRRNYFLLMEGYMDVIALHQAGIDCAVATLGTAVTEGHARLLKRQTDNVILTYDSDAAGVKAAMHAIPILREAGLNIRVLDLKPYKDPDELIVHEGAEAYEQRIREAVNFFLYQSDVWKTEYDLKDPAGLTAYFRKLAEELTTFEDEAERENYLQAVCARQNIDPALLRKMMNRIGNRRVASEPDYSEEDLDENALAQRSARPKEKDEGLMVAAQMLLNWAAASRAKPARVRALFSEEDMPTEIYKDVYRRILSEKEEKGSVLPASILN